MTHGEQPNVEMRFRLARHPSTHKLKVLLRKLGLKAVTGGLNVSFADIKIRVPGRY